MKFIYSVMLVLVSTLFFFWMYVFIVPPPKLFLSDNVYNELSLDTSSTFSKRMIELSKIENKQRFYYFDPGMRTGKFKPLFLYTVITIILLVILHMFLHWKQFVSMPLSLAIILSFILTTSLWIFPNSIDTNIYLDIHGIRDVYYNIKSLQFLGLFVFLQFLLVLVGFRLFRNEPESNSKKNSSINLEDELFNQTT